MKFKLILIVVYVAASQWSGLAIIHLGRHLSPEHDNRK